MLILRYYLWIVPHLLCGAAFFITVWKGIHRRLPAFATLLAFGFVVELLVGFCIAFLFTERIYRWFVVFDIAAAFSIELVVVHELSRELRPALQSLARTFRPLPRWTAALLVLVAAASSASLPQVAKEQIMNVFDILNFGLNLILIGLLLALFLFTRVLCISWGSVPAGIALGFGVSAATEMAASPLLAQFGKASYIPVDIVRMIAFHVCVLIWLVYLLLPDRASLPAKGVEVSSLEVHLHELQRIVQK